MTVHSIHGKEVFGAPTIPETPVTTSLFQKTVTTHPNFIPYPLLPSVAAAGSIFHSFSGGTKAAMVGVGLGVVCASSTASTVPLPYIATFLALAYCVFSLRQWLLSKLPFLLLQGTAAAGGLAAAHQGTLFAKESVKLAKDYKAELENNPIEEIDEQVEEHLQETPQPVGEVKQWAQEFDQFETENAPQAITPDTPSAQVEVPVAPPQEVAAEWVGQYIEAPVTAPVVEVTALGSIGELASQFFAGEVAQMVSEFLEMGQGAEWSGEFLQF